MGEFAFYYSSTYTIFFSSPKIRISADFHKIKDPFLADMPSFMKTTNYGTRIHGGEDAPSPIPWQVSKEYGCSGTILDSTTVLSAAHCDFYVDEWIRAGSVKLNSGGQVF